MIFAIAYLTVTCANLNEHVKNKIIKKSLVCFIQLLKHHTWRFSGFIIILPHSNTISRTFSKWNKSHVWPLGDLFLCKVFGIKFIRVLPVVGIIVKTNCRNHYFSSFLDHVFGVWNFIVDSCLSKGCKTRRESSKCF